MLARSFVFFGGLLASVAVALDAVGAHALKEKLSPSDLDVFRLAAHYQFLHAIGLVLVGVLMTQRTSRWLAAAGWLMLLGIMLFSGMLDLWLATGTRALMFLVPVGGTSFILAWLAVAIGGVVRGRSAA